MAWLNFVLKLYSNLLIARWRFKVKVINSSQPLFKPKNSHVHTFPSIRNLRVIR